VQPPETPAGFRDLVQHCLADSPEQRPSAADLRAGLAALAGGPSSPPAKSFTSGRAEAHTVAMQKPQKPPKRPIVRIAAVVLLLAAAGVAVLIGSWAEDERSTPPVSAPPPASDTAAPPEPAPTRAETSQAVLGVDEAVGRVASEVEAGQAAGRIRDDVAVDLLNLVRQLEQVDRAEIPARVDQLRQKVRIRVTEEGIDRDQAAALQTRLDELGRASGA
jgi:serine/threonine-protein kinase